MCCSWRGSGATEAGSSHSAERIAAGRVTARKRLRPSAAEPAASRIPARSKGPAHAAGLSCRALRGRRRGGGAEPGSGGLDYRARLRSGLPSVLRRGNAVSKLQFREPVRNSFLNTASVAAGFGTKSPGHACGRMSFCDRPGSTEFRHGLGGLRAGDSAGRVVRRRRGHSGAGRHGLPVSSGRRAVRMGPAPWRRSAFPGTRRRGGGVPGGPLPHQQETSTVIPSASRFRSSGASAPLRVEARGAMPASARRGAMVAACAA